jgi:hypothetical protein
VKVEPRVEALAPPHHRVEEPGAVAPAGNEVEDHGHDRDLENDDVFEAIQRELELEDPEVAQRDRARGHRQRSLAHAFVLACNETVA